MTLLYQLDRQTFRRKGQLDTLLGRRELHDNAIAVLHGGSRAAHTQGLVYLMSYSFKFT